MTSLWILDTNIVSLLIHGRSASAAHRADELGSGSLCVSAVTYAEACFGLAKKPGARHLAAAADLLFAELDILPWTRETAETYGRLRADMKLIGKSLSPLDMLIAAHALEAGATLVSNDRAFRNVPGLPVEDWTEA